MEKRYKSEIMMVLHGMAEGLFEIGAISEQEMLEWDRDCLVQEQKPAQKETHINEQLEIGSDAVN
jgi:DNA-binding transcriptional regulator YiaG